MSDEFLQCFLANTYQRLQERIFTIISLQASRYDHEMLYLSRQYSSHKTDTYELKYN
jgi:hypothetical protein